MRRLRTLSVAPFARRPSPGWNWRRALAGHSPGGLRRWFDADLAARLMYSGRSAQDAAWAYERLRPQASTMYTEPSPLRAWPDVPIVDVRSDRDLLVQDLLVLQLAGERERLVDVDARAQSEPPSEHGRRRPRVAVYGALISASSGSQGGG